MRVTQKAVNRTYLYGVNRNLSELQKSTQKMNSGRNFSRISENVSGGARALKIRTSLARSEQYVENINNASEKIEAAEDTMAKIGEWIVLAGDRIIQSKGPGVGADEKKVLATEIRNIRDSILQAINTKNTDEYVFGGSENKSPISVDANGNILFRGVDVSSNNRDDFKDEAVRIDIGFGLKFDADGNLDETSVVQSSNSALDVLGFGTKVVDGKTIPNNLLKLLDDVATGLETGMDFEDMSVLQEQLTSRHNQFLIQVTEVGNRSKFLTDNLERIETSIVGLKERQDDLEAVKIEEELIINNTLDMAYQISLKVGAKILPQSLFNFL